MVGENIKAMSDHSRLYTLIILQLLIGFVFIFLGLYFYVSGLVMPALFTIGAAVAALIVSFAMFHIYRQSV